MSTTFSNILLDKIRVQRVYTETMMKNMKRKIANESDGDYPYLRVEPIKYGYVDQMRDMLSKNKIALNKFNGKCINKYQDATDKINPIGLEVPKADDQPADSDIKDAYKNLRVVVLDKFQECSKLNEGGEGWVKFIDTLATPSERAENYKIPEFDSMYTQFLKDKKVDKVTRSDLHNAIKTISDYDRQMGQIITDADDYCDERAKACYKYNAESCSNTYEEAVESLAKAMLLIENDFIQAQELEVRSKALLESVKSAHMILFGLCTHNPRNISESSLMREANLSFIENKIDDIIENPDNYVDKEKPMWENNIDKVFASKRSIMESNKTFLSKYKGQASKSSCAGVTMEKWCIPINIEEPIRESINYLLSYTESSALQSKSNEKLDSLYNDILNLESAIEKGDKQYRQNMKSIGLKKAIDILPCISERADWFFDVKQNYSVTNEDVKEAISLMEDACSDFDVLREDAIKSVAIKRKFSNVYESAKISPREKTINNIKSAVDRVALQLENCLFAGKFAQVKTMQAQSRKAITLAARVVKESTLLEEKAELKKVIDSCNALEEAVNNIINSTEKE